MSAAHSPRGSFAAYVWRAKWLFVMSVLFTLAFEHSAVGHLLDGLAVDSLLRLQSPHPVKDVAIVAIDDEDYAGMFAGKSPLDAVALRALLVAVAKGRPRIIGVDLDTSDPSFVPLRGAVNEGLGVPVVWGSDATWRSESSGGEMTFEPLGVLGQAGTGGEGLGIALLPLDADGVSRRYQACFPVSETGSDRVGSLARMLVSAPDSPACRPEDDEPLVLNFAGDRYQIPMYQARDVVGWAGLPGFAADGVLRDKVVLIGGTWRLGRDTYVTPVGPMAGVQIIAQAVSVELHGGGIREIDNLLALAADLALGFLLLWFGWRLTFWRALWAGLLTLVIGPVVASLLVFSAFSNLLSFLPLLVGMFLHLLFDHAREHLVLRSEVEALLREKVVLEERIEAFEVKGAADVLLVEPVSTPRPLLSGRKPPASVAASMQAATGVTGPSAAPNAPGHGPVSGSQPDPSAGVDEAPESGATREGAVNGGALEPRSTRP